MKKGRKKCWIKALAIAVLIAVGIIFQPIAERNVKNLAKEVQNSELLVLRVK